MTAYGIDEAWQRLTPAEMRAAGKTFVVGYVSESPAKNLTVDEVRAYHAAGIAVLLVYEYSTAAAETGAAGGARNAGLAVAQARALGYPRGCAIAFAIDEGSPNLSSLGQYARAFTNTCHAAGYRSMVYGGIRTVRYLCDQHLVDLAWQTYAWSGGQWDPRVSIKQVQNSVSIAGKDVDLDVAVVDDFGAWMPDGTGGDDMLTDGEYNLIWAGAWLAQCLAEDRDTITVPPNPATGYKGYSTPNLAKQERQKLAAAVATVQTAGIDLDALAAALAPKLPAAPSAADNAAELARRLSDG